MAISPLIPFARRTATIISAPHFPSSTFPPLIPMASPCMHAGSLRRYFPVISVGLRLAFPTNVNPWIPVAAVAGYSKKSGGRKKGKRGGRKKGPSKPKGLEKKAKHHKFPCYHCVDKLDSPAALEGHYEYWHKKIHQLGIKCKRCCGYFWSVEELQEHVCPILPRESGVPRTNRWIKEMRDDKKKIELLKKEKDKKDKPQEADSRKGKADSRKAGSVGDDFD